MKTIKTPVRAFGGAIWDRDGHISCNAYTQSRNGEIAAELARVINSHDALVEAVKKCEKSLGLQGLGDSQAALNARAALKLAEGGK